MKETWSEFLTRMKKLNWNYSPYMGSGNPRPEVMQWMKENNPEEYKEWLLNENKAV
jgi:hypothetical protein